MLKKTLLSVAVASAMLSGVATAGELFIDPDPTNSPGVTAQYNPGEINYKEGVSLESGATYASTAANITFAQEIFGSRSEETSFDIPNLRYEIDPIRAASIVEGATIKLTFDRTTVVFQNAVASNQIRLGGMPAGQGFTITSNAGSGSDNNFEIRVDDVGALHLNSNPVVHFDFRTLKPDTLLPAKATRLRGTLQGDSSFLSQSITPIVPLVENPPTERSFQVTVTVQVDNTSGPTGSTAGNDSALPLIIYTSLPAVWWDVWATNNGRVNHPIDLVNQDLTFDVNTGTVDANRYGVNYAQLGRIRLGINPDTLNEMGQTVFGLSGSDQVTTAVTGNFSGLARLGLVPEGTSTCANYATNSSVAAHEFVIDAANLDADGNGRLAVALDNADVNKVYNVCVVSDGVNAMKANYQFAVEPLKVNFGNLRYVDRLIPGGNLDSFWKNSCVASLFNLPSSSVADQFFIRLTNTSDNGRDGRVRGVLYTQDGTRYPAVGSAYIADQDGKSVLKPHETGIYTAAQVAQAFGVDTSNWNGVGGRARLVLEGEFPVCEALGLIRASNGILTNMTATTQGNHNSDEGPSSTVNHRGGNNRN